MENRFEWSAWLSQWNAILLKRLDRSNLPYYSSDVRQAIKAKVLGSPPASEPDLQALETRLGVQLPPSYRAFLLTSNGFLQPGMVVPRLFTCQEVDWFRVIEHERFDFWLSWRTKDRLRNRQIDDDTGLFLNDVESMLVISQQEESGSARYFLNSARVGADGEWEAYSYAHWRPGALRFASFWDLMQRELEYGRTYSE